MLLVMRPNAIGVRRDQPAGNYPSAEDHHRRNYDLPRIHQVESAVGSGSAAASTVFSNSCERSAPPELAVGLNQIHAPSSKGVVRTESINSSYWAPKFLGGRRIEGAAQAQAPSPAVVKRRLVQPPAAD